MILLSETFSSTFSYDDDAPVTNQDISEKLKIAALITLKLFARRTDRTEQFFS